MKITTTQTGAGKTNTFIDLEEQIVAMIRDPACPHGGVWGYDLRGNLFVVYWSEKLRAADLAEQPVRLVLR